MEARVVINKENEKDLSLEEFLNKNEKYDKVSFYEVLDLVPPDDLLKLIATIKIKLNSKATISIQGFDLYELAYAIVNDRLSTINFNKIIENKKQILCVSDLLYILSYLGFKIIGKDIDAMRYMVEAESV